MNQEKAKDMMIQRSVDCELELVWSPHSALDNHVLFQ